MKIDEILLKVMKLDHDKDYEMSVNEGTIEVKDTAQTTKVKDTAQTTKVSEESKAMEEGELFMARKLIEQQQASIKNLQELNRSLLNKQTTEPPKTAADILNTMFGVKKGE